MPEKPNLDSVFLAALEITSAKERHAYLDDVFGSDDVCRAQVEKLLAAHDKAGSFMNHDDAESTVDVPTRNILDSCIGPYKLLQRIGEGGMGVVYMAEQSEPVQRRVALKIIKPGMDSQQIIARFEAERQALAMMDHPNIAKVLEVGATNKQPYFVMELVKGIPITRYCDDEKLTVRERLELFLPICRAVQHAHQKGIIHRDLKPSNILVAHYDDKPVIKVIDFGVAKAINQRLTEKTMFTQYGQIVGTIEYMSPEQARFNQLDVDTRSDVYSLGVLLYELLIGETPFDKHRLRTAAFDELVRIIREEEPPIPSTRLGSGRVQPDVAANRNTEHHKLSGLVRGELDWIVMKALEKERSRRYESANGLATDIERYLNDDSVEACPPTMGYQLGKLIRRNKTVAVVLFAVSLSLVIGIIGTSIGLMKASHEAIRADKELYLNRLALANENLRRNRPFDARVQLDSCPMTLRSWEWSVLHGMCFAKPTQPMVVEADISSLSLARNGERVAIGMGDGSVIIWDRLIEQRRRIEAHEQSSGKQHQSVKLVNWIDPSGDGKFIATTSDGNTVKIWHASTGDSTRTLSHEAEVTAVAFNEDGTRLVTAGVGGSVTLWDLSTVNASKTTFQTTIEWIWSAEFSSDGESIAVGGTNGNLFLWEIATEELVRYPAEHTAPINQISFHPDDERRMFATASIDNSIKIWDLTSQCVLHDLEGHTAEVGNVAFHPAAPRLASVSHDGTVRIWDTVNGEPVIVLHQQDDAIRCAAFSDTGQQLFTGGWDRRVTVWDASPGALSSIRESKELFRFDSRVLALATSSDGKWLAAGGEDGTVLVWDLANDRLVGPIDKHGKGQVVFDLDFTRDNYMVSAGAHPDPHTFHFIAIWDPTSPGQNAFELENRREAYCATIHPSGEYLVFGGRENRIGVSKIPPDDEPAVFGYHKYGVTNTVFSPSGKYLASIDQNRIVKLWDWDQWKHNQTQVAESILAYDARGVAHARPAFHPTRDDRMLVANGNDVVELHLPAGDEITWFPQSGQSGHGNTVNSVVYSPDGRFVVSGGTDATVRIWDAVSGKLLRTILDDGPVNDVVFVSGDRVATSGETGSVKLWNVGFLSEVNSYSSGEQ